MVGETTDRLPRRSSAARTCLGSAALEIWRKPVARLSLRIVILATAAIVSAAGAGMAKADTSTLIGTVTTSLIGGNCGTSSTPFATWGDLRSYTFTNEGGFESGGTGWTLGGGARVVAGN